jgi:hypothetical protein
MATLQNIRDFVRLTLQTDSVDLPDSLVDVFVNEALSRVLGLRDDWPHLYSEGTLAMVSGTGAYVLSSASFTPTTFTTIESIWDDAVFGRSFAQMDYQEAAGRWIGPSASVTADPNWFSVYGGNVYLWPKPNATRTLRVGGYRTPGVVVAGSDVPDIPVQFHAGIEYGVVAMAYAQQEDAQLAQAWRQYANESIMVAMRNLFMNRRHRPIVLFGRDQVWRMSYNEWVRRNVP